MLVRGHSDAVWPTPIVRRTDKKSAAYNSTGGGISILETIGPDNVGNQETVVGGDNKWLNDAGELVRGENDLIIGSGNDSDPAITVFDPTTTTANPAGGFLRTPFAGNVIPKSRINPVGRK